MKAQGEKLVPTPELNLTIYLTKVCIITIEVMEEDEHGET
jgi:hypothetical protein